MTRPILIISNEIPSSRAAQCSADTPSPEHGSRESSGTISADRIAEIVAITFAAGIFVGAMLTVLIAWVWVHV